MVVKVSIKYPRGSEWRKWDLHVHTASSYDKEYAGPDYDMLLCQALRDNEIAAVAITDHFIIDRVRIRNLRKLAPEITFFPGVELRTDKGAPNLHIVLIFSETTDLDILCNDFDAIMLRKCAKSSESNNTIYWDFKDIIEFAADKKGLISIHAGSKDKGLDKVITNATPVEMAIKKEYSDHVHFYEMGKTSDIVDYKEKVFPHIGVRALIMCSDNHDPRNYSIKESLWIKADPTFDGLIQAFYQPHERIYIGNIPPKLDKVIKNKKTYIDSISIKQITEPKNSLEKWFNCDIPINPGLTVIIGNKGSGKSALSDIIGHLCKSKSMKEASFLHEDRFRKAPKNLANDYVGSIRWVDGHIEENVNLGNTNYDTTIENAQYLPQKYIEKVCNDLEDEFQKEINTVIFSYVDVTEKGDARNLTELIENKSVTMKTAIKNIQKEISVINREIIRLEERYTSSYKKRIMDNLKKREDDLRRHLSNKPKEVQKPKNVQDHEYQKKMKEIEEKTLQLEKKIKETRLELTEINKKIDKLDVLKSEINYLIETIERINESFEG